MAKAKEYAARITDLENPQVSDLLTELGKIGKDFYNEFLAIKEARNIKMDDSFFALVLEFDKKFQAFAKIVNEKYTVQPVRPDGFIEILKTKAPQIKEHLGEPYENYKKRQNG